MPAGLSSRIDVQTRDIYSAKTSGELIPCRGDFVRQHTRPLSPKELAKIPQIRQSLAKRIAEVGYGVLSPEEERQADADLQTALWAMQDAKGVARRKYDGWAPRRRGRPSAEAPGGPVLFTKEPD